jgi:excisionase family DNA binding protein
MPQAQQPKRGDPDWLTLGQAAKFLGVAQSTIRKWSDQGRVPAFYTPGRHRRFLRSDLEAFVDRSGPVGGADGPCVLVVDDNAALRAVVRANLEREGYEVVEAGGADEALEAAAAHAPGLVLLDVVLPGTDGWQLLQRLQELYGAVPVIMFSGQVEASSDEVRQRGAKAFVGKPFDPQELVDRARQLLPT